MWFDVVSVNSILLLECDVFLDETGCLNLSAAKESNFRGEQLLRLIKLVLKTKHAQMNGLRLGMCIK